MKIVLLEADALGSDLSFDELNKLGEVEIYQLTAQEEVANRIKDADIVIPNKVLLNEESMKDAKNLKMIAEIATGYNNIDIEYCKSRGIIVTNVRDYSSPTVAQHTFAMALSLIEHLPFYDSYVKEGAYSAGGSFTYINNIFYEFNEKRWGIIGLGNIGRKVAEIATAFGADVCYYSASGNTYDVPYEAVSLEELLTSCDIVSVHCPLNEKTKYMLDYERLSMMKDNSILINVARGPVIKEDDFKRSFEEGKPAMAGLDVFEMEPMKKDSPILEIEDKDRLILTPHIGWGSHEARGRLLNDVIKSIQAFQDGNPRSVVS